MSAPKSETPPPARMPIFKKVLIATVLFLLVLFAFIVSQPAEFRVARDININAPPAVVFAQVDDFHRWKAWSPWANLDPNMEETYEGPASGKGAIYAWSGNDQVGEGRMTIVDSVPDKKIQIQLEFFKPFAATNIAEFTFQPLGEQTRVEWNMTGRNNFIAKTLHIFLDMDAMVGAQFAEGLNNLKTAAEAAHDKSVDSAPK